ncbi:uncharacterized protein EAF02_001440 [Botrytis sinoallii]|uniref:uncharacterized protein n=1 Tax=Botrytis sinoallii TaxID=1463999 RepID=UPI001900B200|nr:uncharacterized protein EAF02_001440 [Botrytis sinoallii]KAF7891115.1 hypothetical protein EAF02_001440 [Botrytis sinoallii]
MSRVLPTLCFLSQKIFRMIEKIHELQQTILNKDDVIHHWWTRAQWAERRVGVLTAEIAGKDSEMAEKNIKIGEQVDEIAGLMAELAVVRAGQQANRGRSRGIPRRRARRVRR